MVWLLALQAFCVGVAVALIGVSWVIRGEPSNEQKRDLIRRWTSELDDVERSRAKAEQAARKRWMDIK